MQCANADYACIEQVPQKILRICTSDTARQGAEKAVWTARQEKSRVECQRGAGARSVAARGLVGSALPLILFELVVHRSRRQAAHGQPGRELGGLVLPQHACGQLRTTPEQAIEPHHCCVYCRYRIDMSRR